MQRDPPPGETAGAAPTAIRPRPFQKSRAAQPVPFSSSRAADALDSPVPTPPEVDAVRAQAPAMRAPPKAPPDVTTTESARLLVCGALPSLASEFRSATTPPPFELALSFPAPTARPPATRMPSHTKKNKTRRGALRTRASLRTQNAKPFECVRAVGGGGGKFGLLELARVARLSQGSTRHRRRRAEPKPGISKTGGTRAPRRGGALDRVAQEPRFGRPPKSGMTWS